MIAMQDGLRVLFVEDEPLVRQATAQSLELAGFAVLALPSAEAAMPHLSADFPGVLVTDVRLGGASGLDLLHHCRNVAPGLPVILVTGHGDITMAVQAMREGAYDFIEKPFSSERLVAIVRHAIERRQLSLQVRALRDALENWQGIQSVLIGRSAQMQQVRQTVKTLAETSADVLVYGETGTGKELVARCLHDHSARRRQHFVPLNCGGLPESLAESELFGHEAGAFTGASRMRVGKFEYASGGTLFLDEIGDLPLDSQASLLRFLQQGTIERLGGHEPIPVDVRIVSATRHDLDHAVAEGTFRADLYHRLCVLRLRQPPLRERGGDIDLLADHALQRYAQETSRGIKGFSPCARLALHRHDWPGNVRELINRVRQAVVMAEGRYLTAADLHIGDAAIGAPMTLDEARDAATREAIERALQRNRGRLGESARELGVSRVTLYRLMQRLGMRGSEEALDEAASA